MQIILIFILSSAQQLALHYLLVNIKIHYLLIFCISLTAYYLLLFLGSSFIIKKKALIKINNLGHLRASSGGHGYLKQWIWWTGFLSSKIIILFLFDLFIVRQRLFINFILICIQSVPTQRQTLVLPFFYRKNLVCRYQQS